MDSDSIELMKVKELMILRYPLYFDYNPPSDDELRNPEGIGVIDQNITSLIDMGYNIKYWIKMLIDGVR